MSRAKKGRRGEACYVYPDGTVSDRELHEELLAGIDDRPFIAQTRESLAELGLPRSVLDRLFPLAERDSTSNPGP